MSELDKAPGFIDILEVLAESATSFTNTAYVRDVVRPKLAGAYERSEHLTYRHTVGDKWQNLPIGYRTRDFWEHGASAAIDLAEIASNRMVEMNKQIALEGLAAHFGVDIGGLFDDHWSRDQDRDNSHPDYQPESFSYALDTLKAIKFIVETPVDTLQPSLYGRSLEESHQFHPQDWDIPE